MTFDTSDEKKGSGIDVESQEPKLEKRMLSFLMPKRVPPVPLPEERKHFPNPRFNILSRIFIWWLTPMLRVGYRRTLRAEDMFILDHHQMVQTTSAKFIKILRKLAESKMKGKKAQQDIETDEDEMNNKLRSEDPNSLAGLDIDTAILTRAFFQCFGHTYAIGICELFVMYITAAFSTLPLKALTNFVDEKATGKHAASLGEGIGYAIACCALVLFEGLLFNHAFNRFENVGAELEALLTKSLMEKAYRIDAQGHHNYPSGKIISLMSTDTNRIDLAMKYVPILIVSPFPVIISIILLIINIGVSSLAGIAVFAVSGIMLTIAVRPLMAIRETTNKYTDKRISIMQELLKSFKMVKLFCREHSYWDKIKDTRNKEMRYMFKIQNIRDMLTAYSICLQVISSMVTFCVLYAVGINRSAGDIFASVALFSIMAEQFSLIPVALSVGTDFAIAVKRIGKFLSTEEVPLDGFKLEELKDDSKTALEAVNCNFYWDYFATDPVNIDKESKSKASKEKSHRSQNSDMVIDAETSTSLPQLRFTNINLSIKKGELIVVVGQTGSGKSSLLEALSGFMNKKSGHIRCSSHLIYCGHPWIQHATVRNNITFGRPFDLQHYNNVVDACCLEYDFEMLPGGDHTEVGELGATLSGGQRARINLARAVYGDYDIFLLDDVFSAVDANVSKQILHKCIMGMLADKTRVLATNELSLVNTADRIVYMNGDGTIDVGTKTELLARNKGFANLMKFGDLKIVEDIKDEDMDIKTEQVVRAFSKPAMILNKKEVHLIEEEERAENQIKFSVYYQYFKQGCGVFKWGYPLLLFISLILATFSAMFTNTWLSFWTENRFEDRGAHFYIAIYVALGIISIICLTFEYWLLVYFFNTASRRLNLNATKHVLHSPTSFVENNPIGRIMNRFTKDTDVCDNELLSQYRMFLGPFFKIIATLVLCIGYIPWFAIAIPILTFLYVAIASFYLASSREVKRLEAVQRSFVYSHVSEALGGMNTIKAYRASPQALSGINPLINSMDEAHLISIANHQWLTVNLDLLTTIYTILVALLCAFRVSGINGPSTGLILTYALNLSDLLSLMLGTLTQIETEMNSVERLNYYVVGLNQEAPYELPGQDPPSNWPQKGGIHFKKVWLRYRSDIPFALKDITIDIKPHSRCGFCGRSGAGKSSIMSCLFRLHDFEGKIEIDGVDISNIGLHTLRSRLMIIPQDPALFSGTIRENLDLHHQKTDDELWHVLRQVDLITDEELVDIKKHHGEEETLHRFHLDKRVEGDGTNFSIGERQLLALARALVGKTRILILDEATSNIDYETDAKIQKALKTAFANCTVLCIAHRLKTIISYDKIVVLDAGNIKETDTPYGLYKKGGDFRKMCDYSNITEADFKQKKE